MSDLNENARQDGQGVSAGAHGVPPDKRTGARGIALAAGSLVVFWILIQLLSDMKDILQPLVIAAFLGQLILPAHRFLVRRRVPSALSFFLIAAGVFFALYGMGSLLYASVNQLSREAPAYGRKLDSLLTRTVNALPESMTETLREDLERNRDERLKKAEGAVSEEDRKTYRLADLPFIRQFGLSDLTVALQAALGTFLGFVASAFVVLFYLVFLIAESTTLRRRVELAFEGERTGRILEAVSSIREAVTRYLVVKTVASALTAIPAMIVLALFGVDLVVLWGVVTFIMNFVPYVGSIIATALPVLLALLQFDSPLRAVAIGALLIGIQQAMGNVVEPRMAGEKLGVSPLMILLALAFWGWVWGFVGVVLAVPLIAIVKIILEKLDSTRPIAVLMSNR